MLSDKTILIVDDNLINRKILIKILSGEYRVLEAGNGEEALAILRQNYDAISLVLLDIMMPVMDGYDVLREMQRDENLSQIPVIVASGQGGEEMEVKALSLGASDYILKPYKPEIIRRRIANTIYFRETAAFVNTVQNDHLTGLFGKEYFSLRAAGMLKADPEKKYDLICCDIERFKLVNDLYGTQTGDELLRHMAAVMQKRIANHGICGRIGPDLFAMFIDHQQEYRDSDFESAVEEIYALHINLNIIVRYGIYVVEDRELPIEIMCDRACLAKQSVKGKYGEHFAYYDEKIRQKLLEEQYITAHMKAALCQNEFEVYFQPKYDLKTERIAGAEALVRWNNPERGFLSPGDFIPLFEKNGFITDLDIFVWETT